MENSHLGDFINSLKLTAYSTPDIQPQSSGSTSKYLGSSSSNKHDIDYDDDHIASTIKKTKLSEDGDHFGYVEAYKLEYAARVLQKQIKIIIDEAPNIKQLNEILAKEDSELNTKVNIQQNHLVLLAAKLKTQYKQGKLKIFDQILEESVEVDESGVSESESDSSSQHRTPSYSKHTSPSPESESETSAPAEPKPVDQQYPPLPPIKDPHLYNRVFMHKSAINNKSYLNQLELINSHNERLEFLGDSILNNLVTVIIYNRFPQATEGDMSKIRSSLVNNATLTDFSLEYGFDKKLKSNIHDQFLRQGKQKIFADIFEAYIGALAIEHELDFAEIKDWLNVLLDKKLRSFDFQLKKVEQINKDAKSELYSLIGTAASHPQYIITQTGDGAEKPYTIKCTMGSDVLGVGVAPGLKEAGLRAAMKALKNKPLLEKYVQIRLNTDRSQSVIKSQSLVPQNAFAEAENARNSSPSPSPHKLFPLMGSDEDEIQTDAKNELYALLGHNIGISPTYVTTLGNDQLYKAELKVNDIVLAIAYDKSKKKATAKAAMAFLQCKLAISELFRITNK